MPSVEQRRLVRSLAACGIRQEEIAHYLGLRSVKTLRRHFREELGRAAVEATARVAQTLYQQATSGKNTAATIYWLTRARWREPAAEVPVQAPPFVVMREKDK
jgi:predicted acetyltransferase